jgi:hypothetical protein
MTGSLNKLQINGNYVITTRVGFIIVELQQKHRTVTNTKRIQLLQRICFHLLLVSLFSPLVGLSPPTRHEWWSLQLPPQQCTNVAVVFLFVSDDRWWWMRSNRWNKDWKGKPKYSEKTCSSATLSTTNPTQPDLSSNPGRRGGKPANNRLSYGTA